MLPPFLGLDLVEVTASLATWLSPSRSLFRSSKEARGPSSEPPLPEPLQFEGRNVTSNQTPKTFLLATLKKQGALSAFSQPRLFFLHTKKKHERK